MGNSVLELDKWETPASAYAEEQIGEYRIEKHTYKVGNYRYYGIDGFDFYVTKVPLTITALQELRNGQWQNWMLDNPTNYRAMQKYAEAAYGRVLTSGLGLGLIVYELLKNSRVESVTAVECSPPVIALVGKYLPRDKRVKVLWGDFWKFIACDSNRWDWIIIDLWVAKNIERHVEIYEKEVLPASKTLRDKYPEAEIVFHSFAGEPTIDQVRTALLHGGAERLLWGLGEKVKVK